MYIIKKGKLDVVAPDGIKVFVTLGEGVVFGELRSRLYCFLYACDILIYHFSIMNIPGSKMGNRRSANIRSVGYSDLFSLSKDDLWETLEEYPEAKKALLEKGREILIKDNMIDEEKAREEAAAHETNAEAVTRMGTEVEEIMAGMAKMMAEYRGYQVSRSEDTEEKL